MIVIQLHESALQLFFGEGNVIRPFAVQQGIPHDAVLRKAFVKEDMLELHFFHPKEQGARAIVINQIDLHGTDQKPPEEAEEPN